MSTTLAQQILSLSLDDNNEKRGDTAPLPSDVSPPPPGHARTISTSSVTSFRNSDESASTPNRPPRSPLRSPRRRTGDSTAAMLEIDNLQVEVASLLDKIYEIEELRHSPSLRAAHASRLDSLLSEVHETIINLSPRVAAFETNASDAPDITTPLHKDWAKVTAQHAQLEQEMQEDPWLVRFRTTADQTEGMMDPLQSSLVDLTNYAGRVLMSFDTVPLYSSDGLSIERLRTMAASHGRIKSTYVPSVNRMLLMMDKSVSCRTVKNGEALRRLNDMSTRWSQLQDGLAKLDGKVALALSQNDPDANYFNSSHHHLQEVLGDDFVSSPKIPMVPTLDFGHEGPDLARVLSAGAQPITATIASSLAPPPVPRTGSVTPNAQRTLRRAISRPSLSSSQSHGAGTPLEKPRWMYSTKAGLDNNSPPPHVPTTTKSQRRTSYGGASSHGGSTHGGSSYAPSNYGTVPRRTSSPTLSSPSGSVISSTRAPLNNVNATPRAVRRREDEHHDRLATAVTPLRRVPVLQRTPAPTTPGMRPRPSGVNTPGGIRPRPSFGSVGRVPPPSAFRVTSPMGTPSRPGSRAVSVNSVSSTIASVGLRPFVPSKYDNLDLEVQRVIDAVNPGIFIARIDQPVRRGQRKREGELWSGEFLFGASGRKTVVKLVELAARGTKRIKCMIKVGGAFEELGAYLTKLKIEKENEQEELDDDIF